MLRGKSRGKEVLQEYQTTETLTDAARSQMVNILVAHMIDNQGYFCFISAIVLFSGTFPLKQSEKTMHMG